MGNSLVRYASRAVIRLASGLVVVGGDSRPRGRGFESQRQILVGHVSQILL